LMADGAVIRLLRGSMIVMLKNGRFKIKPIKFIRR
jgi:hypothetical protein